MATDDAFRARIVEGARAFLGTPYRQQASAAGAGCDCIGLVRGVWRALYGAEPEDVPAYTPDWGEAASDEVMLGAARRHLLDVPEGAARPGDVLVFRMRDNRVAKHCAILSGPALMIHAQSGDHVREVALSTPWRRRLAAVFAFPQGR